MLILVVGKFGRPNSRDVEPCMSGHSLLTTRKVERTNFLRCKEEKELDMDICGSMYWYVLGPKHVRRKYQFINKQNKRGQINIHIGGHA